MICEEPNHNAEESLKKFLKGYDFMRIGQAIHAGHWQSAAMILRRMEQQAKDLELNDMMRLFAGLKQNIMRKNTQECKQILSLIVAKRVQKLNRYCSHGDQEH